MQLFYIPDIQNDICFLNQEESRHCVRVLRYRNGDLISITDGKGAFAQGKITEANPESCSFEIIERSFSLKSGREVHIAIAPTKNSDRLEWFAEKATEIGVDQITPVFCDHSERAVFKINRLEKVVISAAKQSLKRWFPVVNTPLKFTEFVKKHRDGQKFIAWCETGNESMLHTYLQDKAPVTILIGPEGDFSPAEIELAKKNEFIPVSLGESRLRTETAGIVACHTIRLVDNIFSKPAQNNQDSFITQRRKDAKI